MNTHPEFASELKALRRHLCTPQEERVARAITWSALNSTPNSMTMEGERQFVEAHWPNHITGARAAIAAYPEPQKVKPVEGDEVITPLGQRAHLLAIRRTWAWVEYMGGALDGRVDTVIYDALERA